MENFLRFTQEIPLVSSSPLISSRFCSFLLDFSSASRCSRKNVGVKPGLSLFRRTKPVRMVLLFFSFYFISLSLLSYSSSLFQLSLRSHRHFSYVFDLKHSPFIHSLLSQLLNFSQNFFQDAFQHRSHSLNCRPRYCSSSSTTTISEFSPKIILSVSTSDNFFLTLASHFFQTRRSIDFSKRSDIVNTDISATLGKHSGADVAAVVKGNGDITAGSYLILFSRSPSPLTDNFHRLSF